MEQIAITSGSLESIVTFSLIALSLIISLSGCLIVFTSTHYSPARLALIAFHRLLLCQFFTLSTSIPQANAASLIEPVSR